MGRGAREDRGGGYGRRKIRRKNRRWDFKKCGSGEEIGGNETTVLIIIIEKGLKRGSQEKKGAGGLDPLCPSIAHSFRKKDSQWSSQFSQKYPFLAK